MSRVSSNFAEGWIPTEREALIGQITSIDRRESKFGGEYPIVTIRQDDGEEKAFHAHHAVAHRELEDREPQIGQQIKVVYKGKVTENVTRPYHSYSISVSGEPDLSVAEPTPPTDDDGDIPF
jgi:hypothetical protein